MILLTVGAQMPFDRLVGAVDDWAGARGRTDVVAQIGTTRLQPRHLEWTPRLDPLELRQRLWEADAVITHAGMGTIITALELGKPVLVVPRRADLRETRNDHQFATARAFAGTGQVAVAWDERDLPARLDDLGAMSAPARVASHASMRLLVALRSFIGGEVPPVAARPETDRPDVIASLVRDIEHEVPERKAA